MSRAASEVFTVIVFPCHCSEGDSYENKLAIYYMNVDFFRIVLASIQTPLSFILKAPDEEKQYRFRLRFSSFTSIFICYELTGPVYYHLRIHASPVFKLFSWSSQRCTTNIKWNAISFQVMIS